MRDRCNHLAMTLRREDGQAATEHGMVIALIVVSLALTVGILATSTTTFVDGVAGLIDLLAP